MLTSREYMALAGIKEELQTLEIRLVKDMNADLYTIRDYLKNRVIELEEKIE
jgi:hypothetical protein